MNMSQRIETLSMAQTSEQSLLEQTLSRLFLSGYNPRTLLDVGAHIGSFSQIFRYVFPNAKLTLVEPNPHCHETLIKSGCEVAPIAASCENGIATLFLTNEVLQTTGASLYRECTPHFNDEHLVRCEVQKACLDDYFKERVFDFIKIDIQGSELDALNGGERLIRQADYVLIELSMIEYNEGEPPVEIVVAKMKSLGFRMNDILEYHRLPTVHEGSVIQIDVLFERHMARATQGHYLAPYGDHQFLLDFLAQRRASSPEFTVIDIGASANPWTRDVIDATFDKNPCTAAKLHFTGNFNDRRDWQPLLDYVEKHGKFSYCICSHTLEDIACPSMALDMIPLIAECGYLATPSRFTEFLRHEGPYRGYIQHRWIFDAEGGKIKLYPKLSFIEYMGYEREAELMGDPNKREFRVFWRKDIKHEILNDDYMGPNPQAVVDMYAKLFSRLE